MIGSLTLDQLRVLVAIADNGSFSAAGRSLGRVQSAVSQSVASLEDTQGVTLFDPIAAVEASQSHQGGLTAPMNGSIVRVLVEVGQQVEAGTQLVVLEAMKMEHSIRAPQAGVVKALFCQEGEMVAEGCALVELETAG